MSGTAAVYDPATGGFVSVPAGMASAVNPGMASSPAEVSAQQAQMAQAQPPQAYQPAQLNSTPDFNDGSPPVIPAAPPPTPPPAPVQAPQDKYSSPPADPLVGADPTTPGTGFQGVNAALSKAYSGAGPTRPPAALPGSGPDMGAALQGQDTGAPQGASQVPQDDSLPTPPVPPASPPPASLPGSGPEAVPAGPQAPPPAAPDGISNNARNNPLNLRFANQDGATDANGFAAFPTPEAGIAAAKNQFSIDAGRGINTLTGLVSSWAPKNENDTAAYIKTVSGVTGIAPDAKIDITDPAIQAKLIPAMSLVENGPGGKGGSAPSSSMTLSSTASPVQPDSEPQAPKGGPPDSLPGIGSSGLMDPNSMDLSRFQSTNGDKLMALGSGLLGAPTFGAGLSKGLANVGSLRAGDRSEGLKTYQELIQARMADARTQQMANMYGLGQQRVAQGAQRVAQGQQRADQGDQRVAISGANSQALNTGERQAAGDSAEANVKGLTEFTKTEATARTSLQNGADVLTLLDKSGGDLTNPDFLSKAKRYLASNFNVDVGDVTPSGLALAQKDIANLANNSALTMTHGTVPRSQAEMATIQKGFGQPVMNADALKAIIQSNMAADQRTVDTGNAWRTLEADPTAKKAALASHSGLFTAWANDRLANNAAAQQNITGQQGSMPNPQIQQTAPGAPFTHVPLASFWR